MRVNAARQFFRELFRGLGPGLITGAADDDPSGIATYSQAGAQFRFGLIWTLVLATPLMISIQMLSARIGWVTGRGLGANIKTLFPRWFTISLVSLFVAANTINIAADIAAMGEAVRLFSPIPAAVSIFGFGTICVVAPVFFSYERSVRILKWLTLALFAYVAVILTVKVPWWARRLAPICFSGRHRKKPRMTSAGRMLRNATQTPDTLPSTSGESGSTLLSAWCSPT
jgi:NRAMP (natural resistance-associated macrophage protein)-like metal ion transporter